MMNGLRIYINRTEPEATDDRIFYSRRSDGPYYRWRFEGRLEQWRSARMHSEDVSPHERCISNWQNVPSALQRSLIDQHVEEHSAQQCDVASRLTRLLHLNGCQQITAKTG